MKNIKFGNTSLLKANVGEEERIISVIAGSFMLYKGILKRRSLIEGLAGTYLLFRGISGYCPGYEALGKNNLAEENHHISLKTTLTIQKSAKEIYEFWRKLENLPLFMGHLESVKVLDDIHSEWKAKLPGGIGNLTWKSEIVKDIPNHHIGWHSLADAPIENKGNIKFIDLGNGQTDAHIAISYIVPGGIVGKSIGKLFHPLFEEIVKEDIENLKFFLEADIK
ncbi:YgaP-like transmembrane domain [Anditalea andensis]|uniref:Uncharacterized protein n=1 Tax=Anditalea andensis TaxID=1048983 RepID=A0A074L118_9BACT|nr:YgaP-like transmembrane domain [Anditalea andensis]KEO73543.1 hypothetical protein EL17_11620 [Anditalea andensis]